MLKTIHRGACTVRCAIRAMFIIGLIVCGCQGAETAPPAPPAPPAIRAAAAILIDAQTGRTLYAREPDRPLPPASTTKIMTGLLLARTVPPDRILVVSPAAASTPGNALGMRPGERFTARDLLYAILLISANDASATAAEQMAGTTEAFAAQMNAEARRLGAGHTHFSNPHGLPAPDHYSTARDLATIAREAMRDPAFAAAVSTRTYTINRDGSRPPTLLTNKNELLGRVPGMDGVKTGWTTDAGYCFVGSATRGGRRLISVVLNSPDWPGETAALLNYGFALPASPGAGNGALAHRRGGSDDSAASRSGAVAVPHPNSTRPRPAKGADNLAIGSTGPKNPHEPGEGGEHASSPGDATPEHPNARTPKRRDAVPASDHSSTVQTGHLGGNRRYGVGSINLGATGPSLRRLNWWWLLWLILICIAARLLWSAVRRRFAMRLSGLLLPLRQRHDRSRRRERHALAPIPGDPKTGPPKPAFTFDAAPLPRRAALEWLESILETPNRLLEPAVRRQARGLVDAAPSVCGDKILPLLTATSHKLRLVAAELLAQSLPGRAEKTLLALLKEEQTPPEVRAEVVQQLAAMGGDRHEPLWLQMLLRDGSPPAAHALASLPRLEDSSCQALRHVLRQPNDEAKDRDEELKRKLRAVQIASVLRAQNAIETEEANTHLQAVPANHRDQAAVSTLRGISRPWPVEKLVDIALHGHGYPALQALLECDPTLVRTAVEQKWEYLDTAARTRAIVLKWLILGEGDTAMLQKLAGAGDDLASGALQLGRTQRWDPEQAAPDALLAAAQIVSLRLGYSRHAQDQIAHAFRKAATGENPDAPLAQTGELEPLAHAYANAQVYDAVQMAMHTEDGLSALLACLARRADDHRYQEEMAFWCDKMPRETRLFLVQAICPSDNPAARAAVAARATDLNPMVRAAALRSLHARAGSSPEEEAAITPEVTETVLQLSAETVQKETDMPVVDQAA